MARYFYLWTPYVVVGTVVLLSLPWLGLIALLVVALVALPALAFAIIVVPYMIVKAVSRRWQQHSRTAPRTTPVLSAAAHQPALRKGYVS